MKLCKRNIEYAGVFDPSTPAEICVEILGLKNVIKQAEELISRHEQALEIAKIMGQSIQEVQQHGVAAETGGEAPEQAQEDQGGPTLVQ